MGSFRGSRSRRTISAYLTHQATEYPHWFSHIAHQQLFRQSSVAITPTIGYAARGFAAVDIEPAGDLSNAALARAVGMSPGRFILWFESHMNQSQASYVRRTRSQKAGRKLVSSEASIEHIAAEVGYPNRHYFSRVFAQHAGCGPAAFRKQYQARFQK